MYGKKDEVPVRGLHHLDLAVADVQRSVAFYIALVSPLGLHEMVRYPTYRGIEEVVYLGVDTPVLGFRPADGGPHRYYDVGVEHFACLDRLRRAGRAGR